MSRTHSAAWWADVEHLREAVERRTSAPGGDATAGAGAGADADWTRAAAEHFDALVGETRRARPDREATAEQRPRARPGARPRGDGRPDRGRFARADERRGHEDARERPRFARPEEEPSVPVPAVGPERRADAASAPGRFARDERPPAGPGAPASARRTVQIRGQVAPPRTRTHGPGPARLRPAPSRAERLASKPDRIALWAFVLGLLLILVAASSSRAAAPPRPAVPAAHVVTVSLPAPAPLSPPQR